MGMTKPILGLKINSPLSHTSLSDALFSATKQRVLGILFSQPDRSFYSNELINLVSSGSGAVQRELASLANSGLVTVKTVAFVYGSVARKNSINALKIKNLSNTNTGTAKNLDHRRKQ